MPRPRLLQAPLLAASRPPSSRSCAATSAKRAHSSAKKNRNREKPEPEYRGHTRWTKSSVNKRRASSSNNYARACTRAHARFLGAQKHKKAAERIDEANYVRVFFLGYETSKDARRLKLPSIGRVSVCEAGTDTPSSGQSSKLDFSHLGVRGIDTLPTPLHNKR